MIEICECAASGYCERRKAYMPIIHFNRCKAGELAVLDNFYSQSPTPSPVSVKEEQKKHAKTSTSIGTKLAEIIRQKTGYDIPCGECKAEVERLNQMTSDEVLKDIDALAQRITERSQANAQRWYHKLVTVLLPELVEYEIRKWITEACEQPKKKTRATISVRNLRTVCGTIHDSTTNAFFAHINSIIPGVVKGNNDPQCHRRIVDTLGHVQQLKEEVLRWNGGFDEPQFETVHVPATWCYAVTTVPSRMSTTLPRTLSSLAESGFDAPLLSVDGEQSSEWDKFQLEMIYRGKNIKTTGHWLMTLMEMYIRHPWTERYAIFQDDFVCVKNLKQYLSSQPIPEKGYLNLLTFMDNETIIADTKHGWHLSHQTGRGAVALVFRNEGARTLLSHPYMMSRFLDAIRGIRVLDGGIVDAMKISGWSEYIHNPSLVQHIGTQSSMGNKRHPTAKSFPGSAFDAMTFTV